MIQLRTIITTHMDLSRTFHPGLVLFAVVFAVITGQTTTLRANSAPVFNTSQANMPPLEDGGTPMTEDETLTIAVNDGAPLSDTGLLQDLNIEDADEPDDEIGIAVTGWAGNGALEYRDASDDWVALPAVSATSPFLLGPDHPLRYVGDQENAETATFTYYLWDGTEGTARETFTISGPTGGETAFSATTRTSGVPVSAVQDPAELNNVTLSISGNDNAAVAAFPGATVDDVDRNPADTLTVRVTVSPKANGSISQSGNPTVSFTQTGVDTGVYSVTGSEANVEAALQLLNFQPVPNLAPVGTNTSTTLTLTVSDGANPPGNDDTESVSVSIASVNDNPVVSPASAERFVFSRGTIVPFEGFSISDADIVSGGGRQTVGLSITEAFTLADGSFVLANGSSSSLNTLTFNGLSIEAAIAELVGLRYVASSATLATPEAVTLTLLVTDQAGGTRTAVVTVTVATPNVSSNIRGTEADQVILDTGVRRLFEHVTITGTNVASLEVTARMATGTLAGDNAVTEGIGVFVQTGGGPPPFTQVGDVMVFSGPASEAAAALNQLAFQPIPNMLGGVETVQFELDAQGCEQHDHWHRRPHHSPDRAGQ